MQQIAEPGTHRIFAETGADGPYVAIGEDLRAYRLLIDTGYPDSLSTARLLQAHLYEPACAALRLGVRSWTGTVKAGRYPAVEFEVEAR